MANTRKYMFDHDFGPHRPQAAKPEEPAAAVAEEVAAPPPPMFTEDEINLARDSAFDEGRRQGVADATEAAESRIAQAMASIAASLGDLGRRQEEANDDAARNAVRVAFAAVRKVLPAACETYAFEEVAHVVEEVIGHVLDEPRIIVRVADELVEPVRGRLEAVAEAHGFEGRVVVQADGRLGVGDCRVEWTDGGAERDQARLLADVDAAVERALAPPERPQAVVEPASEAADAAAS
jgi:flagellar assembly protein FliH